MNIKQRIRRLEDKARTLASDYSHLSDDELSAQIIRLAGELQVSGLLDPETETVLRANELWFGNDPR